jgi:hypothetical protein
VVPKVLDLGAKGLWGEGVGRYGDTTLSDVTDKPNGEFADLKNYSFLTTAEINASPRLVIYLNYGGDIVDHTNYTTSTITGAKYSATGDTITYKIGTAPVGYGSPLSSNSSCLTTGNPTYTGVGFYPAGSCSAATRFVKEYTAGYWYDLYRGPAGRLRQGVQWSYADRQSVTDSSGNSTKGLDNMFWTSFRYYLP